MRKRAPHRAPRVEQREPALLSGDELARSVLRQWIGGGLLSSRLIDADQTRRLVARSAVVLPVFLAVLIPMIVRTRRRHFAPIAEWLRAERPPTEEERQAARDVIGTPLDAVRVSAVGWSLGAIVFGLVGGTESLTVALYTGVTVALGGATTCAVWYLLLLNRGHLRRDSQGQPGKKTPD